MIERGGFLAQPNREGVELSQEPERQTRSASQVVKDIRRRTRKQHSSEEKIRIVLVGLLAEARFSVS